MTRIDASGWAEVRLGDILEFTGIKQARTQLAIPDDENGIPYVVQSIRNNMIARYVDRQWLVDHDEPPVPGNAITLGVTLPAVAYQPDEFGGSQIITARNESMNEYSGNFLVALLSRIITRFAYDEKPGIEKYRNLRVPMPVTDEGEPDWKGMEDAMRRMIEEAGAKLDLLARRRLTAQLLDASGWGEFLIGDLFVIQKGTRLTRADMLPGGTPFIGATLENNGVTALVGNKEHIHPGGVMTVAYNGQKATGKAFWQPKPFWASDDVNVLYPRFELTEEVALFLQPLFWEAGRPYSFGDKWGKEVMEKTMIRLPVCKNGEPDWRWMDDYMRIVLREAERDVSALCSVTPINRSDC